ncbi:MAG: AraC family transcriptional regulator, partial [Oceanococcus sp.]
MSTTTATVTMANCRLLTDYLRKRGDELSAVLAALGISESALADADKRIARQSFNRALDVASTLTGDRFLGLHLGEQIRPAHYGALGYILMSCETPRQAIEQHARWHQLVNGGEQSRYEIRQQQLLLRQSWPSEPGLMSRPAGECHISGALSFSRWIFGTTIDLISLQFPYPQPEDLSEYHRLFGCPLIFDADEFVIAVDSALLDEPMPQADAELRALMQAKAQRQAAEFGLHNDDWLGQLHRHITTHMADQVPDMLLISQAMHISARTLQRRLAQRNTHFKQELDKVRQTLA